MRSTRVERSQGRLQKDGGCKSGMDALYLPAPARRQTPAAEQIRCGNNRRRRFPAPDRAAATRRSSHTSFSSLYQPRPCLRDIIGWYQYFPATLTIQDGPEGEFRSPTALRYPDMKVS